MTREHCEVFVQILGLAYLMVVLANLIILFKLCRGYHDICRVAAKRNWMLQVKNSLQDLEVNMDHW